MKSTFDRMTHLLTSSIITSLLLSRLSFAVCQSRFSSFLTEASEWLALVIRKINVNLMSRVSMLSCLLARVQFISLWSAARYRSDHAVAGGHLVSPGQVMRGVTWLLPSHSLPPLLQNISAWSQLYPSHVTSPVFIQTVYDTDRDTSHTSHTQVPHCMFSHHRIQRIYAKLQNLKNLKRSF